MSGYKEIWTNDEGSSKLTEAMLMAYMEGALNPEQQREVEKWLSEEGLEADAIEGLQQLPADETKHSVSRLNHKLRQELLSKKTKRKTAITTNNWATIAVIVILLVTILAYVVIRFSLKK